MKIKVKVLRLIVQVEFPKNIDYNKLANKIGVHPMVAYNWLQTGKVHERYLPLLRQVPLELVRKRGANGNSERRP